MTPDIAEQRERLETLRSREREVGDLRDRERELEVECIATDAALGPTRSSDLPAVGAPAAVAIVDALDARDALRERIGALERAIGHTAEGGVDYRERLELGEQALRAWLEAPSAREPSRGQLVIRAVLWIVTLAILWAAWAVHVAFLILLFPMVGATSFLLWSSQDAKWRQLGARRQFEATGLDPPADWTETAVRSRVDAIREELRAAVEEVPEPAVDEGDVLAELDAASALLAQRNEELSSTLASAGLSVDALDDALRQHVRLVAKARRARQDLDRIKAERKALSREVETARENLFRFLARHGEAPSGGVAETSALAAGLDRVAARGGEPD